MTTFATTPPFPVPERPMRIRVSTAGAGANFVRIWATDAPTGSSLRKQLDEAAGRIPFHAGDDGSDLTFTPEVGGTYIFTAAEFTKGAAAYGGRYDGDPSGHQTETQVGSEATVTLHVGQRMTQVIGAGADTASLVVYVWDDTIRATTIEQHGEVSPRVIEPRTPRATVAASTTLVNVAAQILVDEDVSDVLSPAPSNVIDDLINRFNAHRVQSGVHNANDTDNAVDPSYNAPGGPAGVTESANRLGRLLRLHMRNAKEGDPGDLEIGSQNYHAPSSTKRADLENLPLVDGASDNATTMAMLADLWRAYEAHRVNTTYHSTADTTNEAITLPPLLEIHRIFLTALAQSSPTTPPTGQSGVVRLVNTAGFQEEAL